MFSQVKQLFYISKTHIFVFQCIQKTCLEVRNEKLKAKNQTLLMIYKTENVYYYSFVYCVFICNVEQKKDLRGRLELEPGQRMDMDATVTE